MPQPRLGNAAILREGYGDTRERRPRSEHAADSVRDVVQVISDELTTRMVFPSRRYLGVLDEWSTFRQQELEHSLYLQGFEARCRVAREQFDVTRAIYAGVDAATIQDTIYGED